MTTPEFEIEEAPAPTTDDLNKVRQLAAQQLMLRQELEAANAEVDRLNAALKANVEQDLPLAMDEAGMKSFELQSGGKVEVETTIHGGLTKADAPRGLEWMREQGHGSLIKYNLAINFAKGQEKLLKSLVGIVNSFPRFKGKLTATSSEGVHHTSLAAFIRKQVEEEDRRALRGDPLPEPQRLPRSVFKVYTRRQAIVQVPDPTPDFDRGEPQ